MAEPGMKRPVQAQELLNRQNRSVRQGRDGERTKVAKLQDPVTRKAAIVYYKPVPQSDTGR